MEYGRFYFGIPEINNGAEISLEDYEVEKDYEEYEKNLSLSGEISFHQDYTKWELESDLTLTVGEIVTIDGYIETIVSKAEKYVYNGELINFYQLSIYDGVKSIYKFNKNIYGMSLPATVKDVKGNTLSVDFDVDEENSVCKNEKYFTYSIESSAWYCMPEPGSRVHIYFPNDYEQEAIAIHSIRNTESGGKYSSRTENPDIKSFSNVGGSEMQLSPSDINFAADDGKAIAINLSESGDISLTGKEISLFCNEDLNIGTGENSTANKVIISAKNDLQIVRGESSNIILSNALYVNSGKIKYDGSEKEVAELPEKIANLGKDDAAEIERINGQAKQLHKAKLEEAKSKFGFGAIAAAIGAVAVAVGVAALTVATGGAALAIVAIAAGSVAASVGLCEMAEATQDYGKLKNGDYSKSFNFVRDVCCRGNETIYNIVKYGSVLIAGAATALLTGGATLKTLGKIGADMASDAAFNLIGDYLDDGSINNGLDYYLKSMCLSGGICGTSTGVTKGLSSKVFKGVDGAKLCKYNKRLGIAMDATSDMMGDFAYTGDINPAKSIITSVVTNKIFGGDPIDVTTGSLYISSTDVVLPDINNDFKIERRYESLETRVGAFGLGWTSNIENYVYVKNNRAEVLCDDGHVEIFNLKNGEWINEKGQSKNYILVDTNDGYLFTSNIEKLKYVFDSNGKLLSITNKHNNKLKITYDGNEISTIETFSKYKLYFKYKNKKIVEIKDDANRVVQYIYKNNYLTEVVHVDEGITRYTYNDEALIDSITDQNGNKYTKNYFDAKRRVIKQEYPNGDVCHISYDNERETIFYYEGSGRKERYQYNENSLPTKIIYEDNSYEEYRYDDHDNKNYIKDRNGNVTVKEFDDYGNVIKEIKGNDLTTNYYYDNRQNLIKKEDNGGKETLYIYDDNNNLIEERDKIDIKRYKITKYCYDDFGRVISRTDSNGNITKYQYDIKNNIILREPIRITTSSGYIYNYEYDEVGRNTAIETDYGRISFGYNRLDYVTSITDANGNVTRKSYDKMGNLISFYPPNCKGDGYRYQYDFLDRLITIKKPLGIVEKVIRDTEGNIIKDINPNYYDYNKEDGIGTEYVYDKDNRKIKVIYPDGGIERFFYDNNGNVIKHIEPEYYDKENDDGLGYSYTYNEENNLTSIINEKGIVEKRFVYNIHGNVIKEIDNEGNETLYKYDLLGNLVEKRVPVEADKYNVTYFIYDDNGNKVIERQGIDLVDKEEKCTRYNEINFSYDCENRLVKLEDKNGAKIVYKYDCLNNKTFESFKINEKTTKYISYVYDKVGNLIEKKEEIKGEFISPEKKGKTIWAITQYSYDGNGNITKIVTPKGFEITRKYDELDRILEEVQKDSYNDILRRYKYSYDKNNNIISIEDLSIKEITRKKKYIYDKKDRLTHYINATGNTTRLLCDKNDRIIKEILPEQYNKEKDDGLGTTYKYNFKGQVTEIKNPLGQVVNKMEYDIKGNLLSKTDGENKKVEYKYTLLGKIQEIITPKSKKENKPAQKYTYDGRGNITGVIDGNGNETKYFLDKWGRITEIETAEGAIEKYSYDFAGNITSTTDGNGNTIIYKYNSLGLVSEIIDQEGNSEYFYYDTEGNLTKHIDRNNNHVDKQYNIDKNIVSIKGYKIDEEEINKEKKNKHTDYYNLFLNQIEAKNAKGNKRETVEKDNKHKIDVIEQTYKYNKDGSLKAAYFDNKGYQYKYNIEGLLESKSLSGKEIIRYTYDKNNNIKTINVKNQLVEIVGEKDHKYFTYDKQGNTIKEETNTGNNIFEYNTLNQQIKAVTKEGNTLISRYDAEGLRYEIEENEKLSSFIYNKENTLVELNKEENVVSRFTRGYEVVAADIDEERYYYSCDEQGSTIAISDKGEVIRNYYHYDGFGNILSAEENIHNRIKYTGQQFDTTTVPKIN